jgi:centrosomal protein CEP290
VLAAPLNLTNADDEYCSGDREAQLEASLLTREDELHVLREELDRAAAAVEQLTDVAAGNGVGAAPAPPPAAASALGAAGAVPANLAAMSPADLCALAVARERELLQQQKQLEIQEAESAQLLARMREYEEGVYGLREAVREIKEHKGRLALRDREVTDLVAQVNGLERALEAVSDDNEELRHRLGLAPHQPFAQADLHRRRRVRLSNQTHNKTHFVWDRRRRSSSGRPTSNCGPTLSGWRKNAWPSSSG